MRSSILLGAMFIIGTMWELAHMLEPEKVPATTPPQILLSCFVFLFLAICIDIAEWKRKK